MWESILAFLTAVANAIPVFGKSDEQKALNVEIKRSKFKQKEFHEQVKEDLKFLHKHKDLNTYTYVESKYPDFTEEEKKVRVQLLTDLL